MDTEMRIGSEEIMRCVAMLRMKYQEWSLRVAKKEQSCLEGRAPNGIAWYGMVWYGMVSLPYGMVLGFLPYHTITIYSACASCLLFFDCFSYKLLVILHIDIPTVLYTKLM